MVIVRLNGGVGNQLFQFACGRAIALDRKEKLFLDLALLKYEHQNIVNREFKLGRLTDFEIADEDRLSVFESLYEHGNAIVISDDFLKESFVSVLADKNIKAILLDGFFQDEFYFLKYRKLIRKEFKKMLNYYLRNNPLKDMDTGKEIVSIHLRRGDYLFAGVMKVLGICKLDYYQEAVAIIKSQVEDPHFYIFSDDPDQADELFADLLDSKTNFSAVVYNKDLPDGDLVELAVMSRCKHFILANSSYSWWGAYLSDSQSKIVVAPKKWAKDEEFIRLSDAIGLESWIRI